MKNPTKDELSVDYEVIIVGGGPAGLALASELSKKHSLLLIKKNKIGITHKTWTTEEKIVHNAGLDKSISIKFNKCFIETSKKEKYYIYDKIVGLDENKVLQSFIDIIKIKVHYYKIVS